MLSWAWDGNLSSPHGFQIFRNGEPYFSYNVGGPPLKRYTQLVQWPSGCGAPVVWRVAAKVGSTLSDLSAPFRQDLPPCKMYLKVTFDYLQLDRTNEEFDETLDTTRDSGMPCDPLDIYYKLSVWHSHRYFYGYAIGIYQGTYHFVKLDCGTYSILGMADGYHKTLYGPEPHVIIIPLTAGQDVHAIPIQADFQDADGFSSDDLVAGILEYPLDAPHYANPNSKWSECSVSKTIDFAGKYASSHITYTYEYFPNKCMDLPPEMQK